MAREQNVKVTFNVLPLGFLVFLVFLVLKLSHVIDWSWWLVTLPLYIWPAFVMGIGVIVLLFGLISTVITHFIDKRAYKQRQKIRAEMRKQPRYPTR